MAEYLRKGTPEAQQQALGELDYCPVSISICTPFQQLCCISRRSAVHTSRIPSPDVLLHLSHALASGPCEHHCTECVSGLTADCIRHDYASLAENAYPEAYSEFKHSMLLLIFDKELQASPVKQDWSIQTRSDLAGMLSRTLRQAAGKTVHWSVTAQFTYTCTGITSSQSTIF